MTTGQSSSVPVMLAHSITISQSLGVLLPVTASPMKAYSQNIFVVTSSLINIEDVFRLIQGQQVGKGVLIPLQCLSTVVCFSTHPFTLNGIPKMRKKERIEVA